MDHYDILGLQINFIAHLMLQYLQGKHTEIGSAINVSIKITVIF